MEWRGLIFDDLERYVRHELKGDIRRTGTVEDVTNDIDFSLMGVNAAQHRQRAMAYLAEKLGCRNTPESFEHLLRAGAFTDPRRAHLYDTLDPSVAVLVQARQAPREEHLMLLHDLQMAEQAGELMLATSLRDELRKAA